MRIHRTTILARIFDCTPEFFDDRVSMLASLGAMVQEAHKAGLQEPCSLAQCSDLKTLFLADSRQAELKRKPQARPCEVETEAT